MMTDVLPAIVLAGGRATRMGGGDKCLLRVGGRTILEHVVDRLKGRPLALNANGDRARFERFGLEVLPDSVPGFPGPLAGILAGMDWAAEMGASHVISVAGDTPFFPADLADRFQSERESGGIILASSRELDGRLVRQPAFGLWPTELREDLRDGLQDGVRKVIIWAERHPMRQLDFGDGAAFFNINTPEDLAEANAIAEASA